MTLLTALTPQQTSAVNAALDLHGALLPLELRALGVPARQGRAEGLIITVETLFGRLHLPARMTVTQSGRSVLRRGAAASTDAAYLRLFMQHDAAEWSVPSHKHLGVFGRADQMPSAVNGDKHLHLCGKGLGGGVSAKHVFRWLERHGRLLDFSGHRLLIVTPGPERFGRAQARLQGKVELRPFTPDAALSANEADPGLREYL